MFDLFRSREKSVRYLLGALLVLVALSDADLPCPQLRYGRGNASDTIVATIGKDQITLVDVQRTIQNAMKGRQIPSGNSGNIHPANDRRHDQRARHGL